MAWPGGYKSVRAFEAAIEAVEGEVSARAEALGAAEGARALLGDDWRRQWAEDGRLLGAALERAPRVGAMLAQIRAARPHPPCPRRCRPPTKTMTMLRSRKQ